MRDQVRRLTKLATELLDLSRLDAGQIEIERESVFLAGTARLVVDEFAAVARQSQHQLSVEADEDAVALGDELRVVQIIRNLRRERARSHARRGRRCCVRVARRAGVVTLAVEDDGPGVRRSSVGHVFERFYRGDGSTASGSGLGLAIALELARVMGGTLELESDPGRTVFLLTLPSADVAEDSSPEPSLNAGRGLIPRENGAHRVVASAAVALGIARSEAAGSTGRPGRSPFRSRRRRLLSSVPVGSRSPCSGRASIPLRSTRRDRPASSRSTPTSPIPSPRAPGSSSRARA